MSRNKCPEETVKKILDVSLRLFMEKGYEYTSIQDIINELGGLSKGAIYHHFKSKNEILLAVTNEVYSDTELRMSEIRDDKTLNGFQKLKKMFASSLESPSQYKMFSAAPNLLKNPQFLTMQLENTVEEAAPRYVQAVIEEGISDGSIKTEYPKEMSEVLMLLGNIWMNPMVFSVPPEEMVNKCKFFKTILHGLGIDFFDDKMLRQFEGFAKMYTDKNGEIAK